MSDGYRFEETRDGFFITIDGASVYRFSSLVRKLRENGTSAAALAELEADRLKYGSGCNVHGALSDPVIGILDTREGKRVAFACPFCSGPDVLSAWKAEASTILA